MADILSRLRLRRDTAAQWANVNPILADGEAGVERDTGIVRVGDGVKTWSLLPFIGQSLLSRANTWLAAQTFSQTATFNAAVTHTDDVVITGDDSLFHGSNQEVETYYSTAGDKMISKAKSAATWLSQRFSSLEITNFDNTKPFVRGIADAQIELFFNGLKRLETDASGVIVAGRIRETARDSEKWHVVTRVAETYYQNTTGRMIRVAAITETSNVAGALHLSVSDAATLNFVSSVSMAGTGVGWRNTVYADVPPGHYYLLRVGGGVSIWQVMELS